MSQTFFLRGRRREMIAFKDSLNKRLKDKNFRREYDDIRPEMDIIRAIVKTRKEKLIKKISDRNCTGH